MYTGHIAVALAARGLRPDLPLLVLIFASQGCDWVELVARVFFRHSQAEVYAHAFPFVLLGAGGAAMLVWLRMRSVGAALTVMAVYLSHVAGDYVTGFKPLWLGGPDVGLQLFGRPLADFVFQSLLCFVGVAVYARSFSAGHTRLRRLAITLPLVLLIPLQAVGDMVLYRIQGRRERRADTTRQAEVPAVRAPDTSAESRKPLIGSVLFSLAIQSERNATIGSTRTARRAGSTAASTATMNSTLAANTNAIGSRVDVR